MEKIKEIPKDSVDCVISSPPYWALRDYGTGKWVGGSNPNCNHLEIQHKTRDERGGLSEKQSSSEGSFGDELKWTSNKCPTCNAEYIDKQWGMEDNFQDYLQKMRSLMNEVRRIIKPTGSVWINLGDTYNSSGTKMDRNWDGRDKNFTNGKPMITSKNIQVKSRIGIPERFYINCIDDGWIARNHIPWIKPNAMPSSVQDRFTNKWESVFFFAKKQKYFFNLDAVREKTLSDIKAPKPKRHLAMQPLFGTSESQSDRKMLDVPGQSAHSIHKRREEGLSDYEEKGNHQPEGRSHFGTGSDIKMNMLKAREKKEQWQYNDIGVQGQAKSLKERSAYARNVLGLDHDSCLNDPRGKNPGDVIYDHSKPYAVVERYGEVIFRKLPTHDDIREYLTEWRMKAGITIDEIEEHFGNQAGHHWFERDGSYPSVSDWLKLKKLLNFDHTYDSHLLTEYTKPAEKQNDPRGKNPGDVFIINTKPFTEAHFATFNMELPMKILKCSCPSEVCKNCGVPKEAIWKRSSLVDTTDDCQLKIESSQYKLGKSSALRLSGGGETFNAWKTENPDTIIGFTNCGCNAGYEPGIVLDPFFGSGTVGVAAEKLGLNWIGIEINPEYVSDIITKRLEKHKNERMTNYIE